MRKRKERYLTEQKVSHFQIWRQWLGRLQCAHWETILKQIKLNTITLLQHLWGSYRRPSPRNWKQFIKILTQNWLSKKILKIEENKHLKPRVLLLLMVFAVKSPLKMHFRLWNPNLVVFCTKRKVLERFFNKKIELIFRFHFRNKCDSCCCV